ERTNQCRGWMCEGDAGAGDLSKRMNARVCPPRTVHRDRRTLEPGERLFEQSLNRFAVRLTLPPDKARPVVGERQLEDSHLLTTKVASRRAEGLRGYILDPGFTIGLPSAQSGQCSGS